MTDTRMEVPTTPEPVVDAATPEEDGAITGVARGSLGTAANLEDTKVMRLEELRAAATKLEAAREAEAASAPEAQTAAAASPAPSSSAGAPTAAPVQRHASSRAAPRSAMAPAAPNRDPFAGLAGVLAVLVVVLAGAVFLVTRNDQPGAADQGAVPTASAAPTAEQPVTDGNNKGKGNGKGNGNGGGMGN